jgi:hypothetical protein
MISGHGKSPCAGVCLGRQPCGRGSRAAAVVPIQSMFGWRASLFLFGAIGVIWATAWYGWYRDRMLPSFSMSLNHHSA